MSYANHVWTGYVYMLLVLRSMQSIVTRKDSCYWFLGDNDTGAIIYDHVTGGCYDGLTLTGPNLNQGAESTLCGLMALLNITATSRIATVPQDRAEQYSKS